MCVVIFSYKGFIRLNHAALGILTHAVVDPMLSKFLYHIE